jgi:hypothetical protein
MACTSATQPICEKTRSAQNWHCLRNFLSSSVEINLLRSLPGTGRSEGSRSISQKWLRSEVSDETIGSLFPKAPLPPNRVSEGGELLRGQYVFPAAKLSTDPRSREIQRHHVSEKNLQNAVKLAVK